MSALDEIEKYTDNLLIFIDDSGLIKRVVGNVGLLFKDDKSLLSTEISELLTFYRYDSGKIVARWSDLSNGLVVIESEDTVVSADLKVTSSNGETVLSLYPMDLPIKSVVTKSERGSKKDLLDILGKISHDFNNLLGVIMGHAELANYLADNEEVRKKHIDEVLKSTNKIKNIIRQILVYRHHLDDLPVTKVDLKPIINRCVADAREKAGFPVSFKLKQVENVFVEQNSTKMVDVFSNIINNAVQSISGDGSVEIDIQVAEEGFHTIVVKDTGVGMSRKTQEHMFEPFYSTHSRMQAAGVGLATVKGILDDIGGEISIQSHLGQGTEVTVKVPVYKESTSRGKVLLVDDEIMVLEVTADIVESLGYSVVRCEDLIQGEKALDNALFDVMLIDHHLADHSGYELIEYARSRGIKTPAVISCGHQCESDVSSEEIDGYLMKPASIDAIEKMFNSILSK